MRQLYMIPIVHSNEDLGKLRAVATTVKSKLFSVDRLSPSANAVRQFWDELRSAIQTWDFDWTATQIYQDALPSIEAGNDGLIKMIVDDLATQGSQNHQILQWIAAQGGELQGTESPPLLLEEYRLVKESMELLLHDEPQTEKTAELAMKQAGLLVERDLFIAKQIDRTLATPGSGVIFLGILHSIEDKLPSDISVSYPFGKPMSVAVK